MSKVNQVDNISFKALHVTPETLKKIGCTEKMLLSNPMIKKCADKYDVLVTAGKTKYTINRRDGFTKDKIIPTAYLLGTIWSAPHIAEWMIALGVTDINVIIGTFTAILAGAMLSAGKLVTQRVNSINIQGAQKVELLDKVDENYVSRPEYQTVGFSSQMYTKKRNENGIIEELPDIAMHIENLENAAFHVCCLKDVELDNMYTPENYLKNLRLVQKNAKEWNIKDVFGYPVNKGGDTLLTMFFDVAVPQKGDPKEQMDAYYKIIQEISKTDKNNFDQKDSHGITNLEKIMNSENFYILPFLKGSKFSYSPFLKYAYDNIQDPIFKKQLKTSVDFDFNLLGGNINK